MYEFQSHKSGRKRRRRIFLYSLPAPHADVHNPISCPLPSLFAKRTNKKATKNSFSLCSKGKCASSLNHHAFSAQGCFWEGFLLLPSTVAQEHPDQKCQFHYESGHGSILLHSRDTGRESSGPKCLYLFTSFTSYFSSPMGTQRGLHHSLLLHFIFPTALGQVH